MSRNPEHEWRWLALLGLVAVVGAARLAWVPPTVFVEGDDAALCTGIARLSQGAQLGPYAYHPPKLPDDPSSASVWAEAAANAPALALYRYDTMPGMYLIGLFTAGLGRIAERMSWVCFAAGTLLPLLISLFLTRRLQRPGVVPFATCYFMVATSPEIWMSGAAYINDKIVAATFLFAALVLLGPAAGVISMARSRWSLQTAKSDKLREGRPLRPRIFLAGVVFGFAIAARFDTIIFVPAVIAAYMGDYFPGVRRWWRGLAAFCGAAAATVLAIWTAMHASLRGAWGAGVGRTGLSISAAKLYILLSAYGPAQLGLCAVISIMALRYALRRRPRLKSLSQNAQTTDWETTDNRREHPSTLDFGLLSGRLLSVVSLVLRQPPKGEAAAVLQGLSLFLLLVPEIGLWLLLPFSSQKYLLVSSAVTAGLCGLLFPSVIALSEWPRFHSRFAELAAQAMPLAVIVASFLVGFGTIGFGQDGPRPLGGQAFFRLPGVHDAQRMIDRLASAESFTTPVVLKTPSWVLEESLAYECAVRGWTYSLLPVGVRMTWEEALADGFFRDLSGFWEARGLRRAQVSVSVAAYTPPGAVDPVILVPSDWDLALGIVSPSSGTE